MNNIDRKRLRKISERLDELAKEGQYRYQEYKEYIDEIIDDGQWIIFQSLLARKYRIKDAHKLSPVDSKTERIWDIIKLETTSDFQKQFKQLFDTNSCYMIGKKVYGPSASVIGEIWVDTVIGVTQGTDYNAVIAKKGTSVENWLSSSGDLLTRYSNAINFLLD
jgi:hypothetical protein